MSRYSFLAGVLLTICEEEQLLSAIEVCAESPTLSASGAARMVREELGLRAANDLAEQREAASR